MAPERKGRHAQAAVRTPIAPHAVRAALGRLSWGLGDQAVSSITNFVVGAVVARTLGPAGFGVFSLAWVTYGVVLNVSRGLATDPLVVRFSGEPDARWRSAVNHASGTALAVGVVAGGITALTGAVIGGAVGAGFVALGAVLPLTTLQDSWRYAFFAVGQGHKAFANDVVWAAALVPALVLAAQSGTVSAFVLAWGLSAGLAAAFGCAQTRLRPHPASTGTWVLRHRDLGFRYLVENVSISGASQLRMYGLGALAGLAAVGTVRGAELLMGPFLAVLMGVALVAVPEAARVLRRAPHRLLQFCLLVGGAQAAAALAWGLGLLLVLPESVGEYVLGDVWIAASALVLPAALSVTCAGMHTGATAGLRALGMSRRSLRAQLLAAAAYVTCGVAGAAVAGAPGSAWGVALATLFGAVVWWWQLRRGIREHACRPPHQSATPNQESRHP